MDTADAAVGTTASAFAEPRARFSLGAAAALILPDQSLSLKRSASVCAFLFA